MPLKRTLRVFAPALAWALAIWVIGGLADPPSGPSIPGLDKVAHFVMYGVLGYLLGRGWAAAGRSAPWILLLLLPLALGAADELRQGALPTRSAEIADWIADALGATAGFLVAVRRARSNDIDRSE